jgi:hypothetical protein
MSSSRLLAKQASEWLLADQKPSQHLKPKKAPSNTSAKSGSITKKTTRKMVEERRMLDRAARNLLYYKDTSLNVDRDWIQQLVNKRKL